LKQCLATFVKVQNILNKMPGTKEFVQECEAAEFAEQLASELERHG
jgi:type II secretory pathway component PulF